jgi:hypothetical protein
MRDSKIGVAECKYDLRQLIPTVGAQVLAHAIHISDQQCPKINRFVQNHTSSFTPSNQKICPDRSDTIGALLSYKPASYAVAGGFNLLCIYHSVYFGTLTVGKTPNSTWVAL